LTVFTPFGAYFFIYRNKEKLTSTEENPVKQRFGALISGLRIDLRWAKYLLPVYYFQRVIFSFIIVFMRDLQLYQSLLLIIPSGIMVLFSLIARPMKQRTTRVLNIICEIDIFIVFTLLCISSFRSSSSQIEITWVIIGFTLKSFLCTALIVAIHAVIGAKEACKKKPLEDTKVVVETLEPISKSLDFSAAMWGDNTDISFENMKKVTFDRAGEFKERKAQSYYSEVRTDTQESSPTKHVKMHL
jgi:hypothetical protein